VIDNHVRGWNSCRHLPSYFAHCARRDERHEENRNALLCSGCRNNCLDVMASFSMYFPFTHTSSEDEVIHNAGVKLVVERRYLGETRDDNA
jgi:hypothetical protein